jgi:hypothetical protein
LTLWSIQTFFLPKGFLRERLRVPLMVLGIAALAVGGRRDCGQ